MSIVLALGLLCFLFTFVVAAIGVTFVVRAERAREAAVGRAPRVTHRHQTSDITLYLRFDERAEPAQSLAALNALVDAAAPYGVLPPERVHEAVAAFRGAMDAATHGVFAVAAHRVLKVRVAPPGLVICLRCRSRAPLDAPGEGDVREEMDRLCEALEALVPSSVVSLDLLRAKTTSDVAAPELAPLDLADPAKA